eukprot:1195747-Prorocentrum_minimum.AAC.2
MGVNPHHAPPAGSQSGGFGGHPSPPPPPPPHPPPPSGGQPAPARRARKHPSIDFFKTLLSHLVTREFNSPTNASHGRRIKDTRAPSIFPLSSRDWPPLGEYIPSLLPRLAPLGRVYSLSPRAIGPPWASISPLSSRDWPPCLPWAV